MSNTQQAYERYKELKEAYDQCSSDINMLSEYHLRTAINATIEALEAQIPQGEVYTREEVRHIIEQLENKYNIHSLFFAAEVEIDKLNHQKRTNEQTNEF